MQARCLRVELDWGSMLYSLWEEEEIVTTTSSRKSSFANLKTEAVRRIVYLDLEHANSEIFGYI